MFLICRHPHNLSWIGYILLFGWHSRSVLDNIIPQVADRHSDRLVQHTCIQLLRLSRTTLWTVLCCRKRWKTGVLPAAPEEASHIPSAKDATVHSPPWTPFTAPFSSSLLKCIHSMYPIIPLPSIITFEQTTERILELCRSWYMNCLFPLISSIWLMAMVESNMKIRRVLPSELWCCVVW